MPEFQIVYIASTAFNISTVCVIIMITIHSIMRLDHFLLLEKVAL